MASSSSAAVSYSDDGARVAGFKVSVVDVANRTSLPMVVHEGQHIVVATQGREFKVLVAPPRGMRPDAHYSVHLRVDGTDVGYGKIFHGHPAASATATTFKGFLKGASTVAAFKFAEVQTKQTGDAVGESDSAALGALGKIEVIIHEVEKGETLEIAEVPTHVASPTAAPAGGHNLPEGCKFFRAPSLAAEEGERKSVASRWSKVKYTPLREAGRVTIRYETAKMLELREILPAADEDERRRRSVKRKIEPDGGN
jgi:hypothetical protein